MGRSLHNPPIAGASWPTLLARPGHLFLALIITILSALPAAAQSTPVVHEDSIVVPPAVEIYLIDLMKMGVVSGLDGSNSDWLITSSDSDCFYANNTNNYFRANTIGRTTITYTHKDFKDVSFSIEVTSKLHPADYIVDNLGFVYINESKKITIPDEYIPLSDFTTIERADWIEDGDTIADFKVEREGNTLFFTGIGEGKRSLLFYHKYCPGRPIGARITIAEKPAAPVEIYLPESGSDEINGYSYEINQWNDAVTFTGEAPEETTTFVVPLKCNLNGYTLSIDDIYGAAVLWPVTAKLIDNNNAIEFTVKNKYDAAYTVQHYNKFVRLLATSPDGEEDNPWRFYFRLSNDAVKVGVNPTVESADTLTSISINEDKNTIIGSYPAKGSSMTIIVPDMPNCPDYKSSVRVVNPQGMPTINGLATIATTERGTEIKLPLPETSLDSLRYRVDLLLGNDSLAYILWQADMYLTTVKEKPAVEKVEIAADDEKTQELIESGVIAIIDPNEPDAPADPDKPAPEITFTPAVETKDETTGEIVSVEPELLTFTVTSQVEEIPLKVETKEMESVEGRYVAVSSNEAVAIASLDENGNLVIKRNATIGTARIIIIFVETPPVASRSRSISARNGNASEPLKEIIVQVNPAAETTLVLSEHSITLTEGGSIAITASLKDAEGNDSEQEFSVEWSSSDTEVATVDEAGTITAVKAGKATITATCGKLSATCEVTVSEPEAPEVTEINLDTEKISGVEGSTYHLQADVDDLTWSSSDESVAVVDQNGIVTLVGAGRAIITATAPNGVKATCEVVVEAASGINGVEADTEAAFAPVYDLTGRLVARTSEQMATLRAGIYIQAGRKIYISK